MTTIADRAVQTLDGIIQITRNDMLGHGVYIESGVSNPRLAEQGTICGGHRACLLGSAAIGGGAPVSELNTYWDWPAQLARPHVRLAAEALDQVCLRRMKKLRNHRNPDVREAVVDWIATGPGIQAGRLAESYFESVLYHIGARRTWTGSITPASKATRQEVISVCQAAKRRVRKEARR